MKKIVWLAGLATVLTPFAALAQDDFTTETTISPGEAAAAAAAGTGFLAVAGIMTIFWLIFGLGGLILFIVALIDVIRRQFANPSDKTLWLILVILLWVVGPILYLIIGRKKGTIPSGPSSSSPPPPQK